MSTKDWSLKDNTSVTLDNDTCYAKQSIPGRSWSPRSTPDHFGHTLEAVEHACLEAHADIDMLPLHFVHHRCQLSKAPF